MRREEFYLRDIIRIADELRVIVAGCDEERFIASDLVRSAAIWKLVLIREAAGRLSRTLHDRHSYIPWSRISGFRNVAIHDYFGIDWSVVWNTATDNAPQFRRQIQAMLDAKFSDTN